MPHKCCCSVWRCVLQLPTRWEAAMNAHGREPLCTRCTHPACSKSSARFGGRAGRRAARRSARRAPASPPPCRQLGPGCSQVRAPCMHLRAVEGPAAPASSWPSVCAEREATRHLQHAPGCTSCSGTYATPHPAPHLSPKSPVYTQITRDARPAGTGPALILAERHRPCWVEGWIHPDERDRRRAGQGRAGQARGRAERLAVLVPEAGTTVLGAARRPHRHTWLGPCAAQPSQQRTSTCTQRATAPQMVPSPWGPPVCTIHLPVRMPRRRPICGSGHALR